MTAGTLFEQFDEDGIDPTVGNARDPRYVFAESELEGLGFTARQARTPAILYPLTRPDNLTGTADGHLSRPLNPRSTSSGRLVAFETPATLPPLVDSNPSQVDRLRDASTPLFVFPLPTPVAVDAAISDGFTAVGVYGLCSVRAGNLVHRAAAVESILDQLAAVPLEGRQVNLVVPYGLSGVTAALHSFAAGLVARGAAVAVYVQPVWSDTLDDADEDEDATAALLTPPTRDGEIVQALLGDLEPVNTPDGAAVVCGGKVHRLDSTAVGLITATVHEHLGVVLSAKRARKYRELLRGMAERQPLPHELDPLRRFVAECGGRWVGSATDLFEAVPDLAASPVWVGRRLARAQDDGELAALGLSLRVRRPQGVTRYVLTTREVSVADLVRERGATCHLCGLELALDVPATHPLAPERDHLDPVAGGPRDFTDVDALALAHVRCNRSRGAEPVEVARDRMHSVEWRHELLTFANEAVAL